MPGCGQRAVAANTAAPAGRRCARASERRVHRQRQLRQPTCWSTPTTLRGSPTASIHSEVAPILCAGVTVYKGLKVTDTRPGQWVAISGIGGLGHIAVQYARAMGLRVVAIDVDDAKLELATRLGAEVAINARTGDVVEEVQAATGGVHGVLVTAVHPQAFGQAIGLARRGGTIVFNGLPPGDFPAPIFDIVLKGLTIRGSIVGTRQDMAEALDFYARGADQANSQQRPARRRSTTCSPHGTGPDRRPHRHRLPRRLIAVTDALLCVVADAPSRVNAAP